MSGAGALHRRTVVARLLRDRQDLIAVGALGASTFDIAAAGDHPRNFYLWGAMGGAAMVGLGIALAQPERPVVVIAGDGEMLMGLGGLATISLQAPANLRVVVLDNSLYGETGGQPSHTAGPVDLATIGAGCGLAATKITDESGVEALAERLHNPRGGAELAVIKVSGVEAERVYPSRDGVFLKNRLRAALGVEDLRWGLAENKSDGMGR
jgi:thiamine pyrophosphate-dependent acetolactate synthase large subunit-like protein